MVTLVLALLGVACGRELMERKLGMADNGEGAGVLLGASCTSEQGMAALMRAIHSLDGLWTWTGIRHSTGVTQSLGRKSPKGESVQHIQKRKNVRWNTKVLPEVCRTPSGAQLVPASSSPSMALPYMGCWYKMCPWPQALLLARFNSMAMDSLIDVVLAGRWSVSFPSASPPYTSCYVNLQQHLTNPQTSSMEPAKRAPPSLPVASSPHIHIPHVPMTTTSHGTPMRSQPPQGAGHRGRRAQTACTAVMELGHSQGWAPSSHPHPPITRELSTEAKHQKT